MTDRVEGTGADESSTADGLTALSPAEGGDLLEGDDKARSVQSMFDRIAPRYDMVNRIMTFRLDVRWRRKAVRELGLADGSTVLDLACGTGDLCIDLLDADLAPIGMDFSAGMLGSGRSGAPLAQADVLRLPVPDASFDGVTCGFALRNFTDLHAFFVELGRVTRPGGSIALVDAAEPENRILRFGHSIYFQKIVPKIGGLLSDKSAYGYLPKSLAYLPAPEEMIASLNSAGFNDARRQLLFGGAAQLITGTRS